MEYKSTIVKHFTSLDDYQRFCNTLYQLDINFKLVQSNFNSNPSMEHPLIVTFNIVDALKLIETKL